CRPPSRRRGAGRTWSPRRRGPGPPGRSAEPPRPRSRRCARCRRGRWRGGRPPRRKARPPSRGWPTRWTRPAEQRRSSAAWLFSWALLGARRKSEAAHAVEGGPFVAVVEVERGLRPAEEQVAVGAKHAADVGQDALLRRDVEVDQHVPQEDDVQRRQ